eukprot:353869-Chlamydomonas_euryale.AAC.1
MGDEGRGRRGGRVHCTSQRSAQHSLHSVLQQRRRLLGGDIRLCAKCTHIRSCTEKHDARRGLFQSHDHLIAHITRVAAAAHLDPHARHGLQVDAHLGRLVTVTRLCRLAHHGHDPVAGLPAGPVARRKAVLLELLQELLAGARPDLKHLRRRWRGTSGGPRGLRPESAETGNQEGMEDDPAQSASVRYGWPGASEPTDPNGPMAAQSASVQYGRPGASEPTDPNGPMAAQSAS